MVSAVEATANEIDSSIKGKIQAVSSLGQKRALLRNAYIAKEIENLDLTSLSTKDSYIAHIKQQAKDLVARSGKDYNDLEELYKKKEEAGKSGKNTSIIDGQIDQLFEKNDKLIKARAYSVLAKALSPEKDYPDVFVEAKFQGTVNEIRSKATDASVNVEALHGRCVELFSAIVLSSCGLEKTPIVINRPPNNMTLERVSYRRFKIAQMKGSFKIGSTMLKVGGEIVTPAGENDPLGYLNSHI